MHGLASTAKIYVITLEITPLACSNTVSTSALSPHPLPSPVRRQSQQRVRHLHADPRAVPRRRHRRPRPRLRYRLHQGGRQRHAGRLQRHRGRQENGHHREQTRAHRGHDLPVGGGKGQGRLRLRKGFYRLACVLNGWVFLVRMNMEWGCCAGSGLHHPMGKFGITIELDIRTSGVSNNT